MKTKFAILALLALTSMLFAESRRTSGNTLLRLVFPAGSDATELTAVRGVSDSAYATVTVRGKAASTGPYLVNGGGAANQARILLADTTGLASNDTVVVQSVTNAAFFGTVTLVTSTNITLGANLTSAVVSGDSVFKVTPIYTAKFIETGPGTNLVSLLGNPVAKTLQRSPLVVELDCSTNANSGELSATVK